MIDPKKKKQTTRHFIFAVLWIVKACVLYVFCDEFVKLAMREELDDIKLYGKLDVHVFWLIAGCLIGAGILIDLAMLISSLFSKRVAVGFLALSFLVHNVVIVPQHITGFYMASRMHQKDSIQIGWKKDFDQIENECKKHHNTTMEEYAANSTLVRDLKKTYNETAKIQKSLGCCGWKNYDDWNSKRYCSNVRLKPDVTSIVNETSTLSPFPPNSSETTPISIFGPTKIPLDAPKWWADTDPERNLTKILLPDSCCKRKINFEREIEEKKNCDCPPFQSRWSTTGCERVADDLIKRVLMVFSCVIVSVELIYFLISILFYLFLTWKPIEKSPSNSEDLGSVNRVASPSNTFRGSKTSVLQNVFTSEKEEMQDKDKDGTQEKDKDGTQEKDKDGKTKQTTTQTSVDK